MTAPWLIALLVAAVLALTVFDLLVSFNWKSYLARGLGAAQAVDEPDETDWVAMYDEHFPGALGDDPFWELAETMPEVEADMAFIVANCEKREKKP